MKLAADAVVSPHCAWADGVAQSRRLVGGWYSRLCGKRAADVLTWVPRTSTYVNCPAPAHGKRSEKP